MRLAHKQHRRGGFTLVELIVAAGLTVLIMTVLASGFQAGLQSLSHLKSAADLADRLRNAEALLRQDMNAEHFDSGGSPGVLRPSDLRFDLDPAVRPAGGFVQIRQSTISATEGIDQDSLSSTRALTHGISMSVRRQGRMPSEMFAAVDTSALMGTVTAQAANQTDVSLVPNSFLSEWAEVHWFVDLTRPTVQNGVNTFPLCRRVRLLTKQPVGGVLPTTPLAEVVSADPTAPPAGNGATNTLATISNLARRLGSGGTPAALTNTSARVGDDIVITNVIGFEVKPTWELPNAALLPRVNRTASALNADFPFDDFPALAAPNGPLVAFDTAVGGFAPLNGTPVTPARITGVQIKIRVYDGKNRIARQSVVTSKW